MTARATSSALKSSNVSNRSKAIRAQVKTGLDPARYTIRTVPKLLAASKAWEAYDEAERPLADAIKKLGRS